MEELSNPLIRKSLRNDTLSKTGFVNSFLMGQAVKKRTTSLEKKKIDLSPEHKNLNELFSRVKSYIYRNAETTLETLYPISFIRFTDDNDTVVFGSSNGNISKYSISEGKIIDDKPLNIGALNDVVLDEAASRAIIVGADPAVRLYALPNFELKHEMRGHTMPVRKCVISPTTNSAFTISEDRTVRKWDLSDCTEKGVLMTHEGIGFSLAVTPDARYVFSGGEDKLIRVFDLKANEQTLNLNSHTGSVTSLAVNSYSTLLASGGTDNLVIVWNITDLAPVHVFSDHTLQISVLEFSNGSEFLVSGSLDNTIRVWDLMNDRREFTLNSHLGPLTGLLIKPDNDFIVSCSDDKAIKIWRFPEFHEETIFKILNNEFLSIVQVDNDIVSCGSDHMVRCWDIKNDEARVIYKTSGIGLKIKLSQGKKSIAVGDDFGQLYLFDREYKLVKNFQAHKGPIRDICFIANGDLVTGGGDSKILIWDIKTWNSTQLKGHQQSIWCLTYSFKNDQYGLRELLASGSSDKTVRLWDAGQKTEIFSIQVPEQVTSICITEDACHIITGSMTGTLIIWNIAERLEESVFNIHTDMITGIQICSDMILSVSKDKKIQFTSLAYRIPISYMTRKQPILCVELTSDRKTIITGEFQMIYLQDNPTQSSKERILGPEDSIVKFLAYVKKILDKEIVPHDPAMDNFVVLPYFFNTLHIYSFLGLRDFLKASLTETAVNVPNIGGFHPLYISLIKGLKGVRDDIVEALIAQGATNPYIFQILENVMVEMNRKAFPMLGSLYEAIYKPVTRSSLPKFCSPDINLPISIVTAYPKIKVDDFFKPEEIMSHGKGILFKESYVKLNYVMGSSSSIEYLESLSECSNLDVMRSPLIQAMVAYKWEYAKFPMIIQGIFFYSYLLALSVYTVFFLNDKYFLIVLFTFNTLLLTYELFQMTVSGSFYFRYVWNYIDWTRGLLLFGYIFSHWFGIFSKFSYSVLSFVIFLSFVRGISYFRLFKITRYLINLLFEVLKDMSGFLILLIYSTLAFCFLFIVLDKGSAEKNAFSEYLMRSYKLMLGDFENKDYNIIEYLCVTFALLINPIIMLNLLISIIGDSYDRIQSDSLSADIKELMDMIQEVENMLFYRRKQDQKQFFFECTEYEKEDQDGGWEGKIRALEGSVLTIKDKSDENYKQLLKKIKMQDKIIEIQSEKVDTILKKVVKKYKKSMKKKDKLKIKQ